MPRSYMLLGLILSCSDCQRNLSLTRTLHVAVRANLRIVVGLISSLLANRRRANLCVSAHQSTHHVVCVDTILHYVTATSSGSSSKDDVITADWSNATLSIPDMTSADGVTGASSASSSAHGSFDRTDSRNHPQQFPKCAKHNFSDPASFP